MYIQPLNAIQQALALHGRGVYRINRDELVEGLLDMQKAERLVQVNVVAIRSQDSMTQQLLDIYG